MRAEVQVSRGEESSFKLLGAFLEWEGLSRPGRHRGGLPNSAPCRLEDAGDAGDTGNAGDRRDTRDTRDTGVQGCRRQGIGPLHVCNASRR